MPLYTIKAAFSSIKFAKSFDQYPQSTENSPFNSFFFIVNNLSLVFSGFSFWMKYTLFSSRYNTPEEFIFNFVLIHSGF